MKGWPTEWEEILSNEEIGKGLISKIYKHLLQLNTKKQKAHQEMGRRSKQIILQRRHTDGQKKEKSNEKKFNITHN